MVLVHVVLASALANAEEVRIGHADLTLNADLELASGKTVADGVVLLLHGTLGHKDMEVIATFQSLFLEYGHSSLAINLSLDIDDRHGFYPCERVHTHENADALVELDIWLTWLLDRGAGNIVLFGHSRGGNQIARFVLQYSPDIAAAILLAPSTSSGARTLDMQSRIDKAGTEEGLVNVDFLHCKKTRVSNAAFLSYYETAGLSDTPALLRDIAVPVLILSGSEDTVVPDLGDRMKDVVTKFVRHVEIDGAGHFFLDLYAYEAVEEAIRFLEYHGFVLNQN